MALAAILCACNKEQMIESEVIDPVVEPSAPLVFTATMEDAPASKATFDNTAKCASWEVGDQINVNNLSYKAITAGTNTTFTITNVTEEIRPTYIGSSDKGHYGDDKPSNLVDDGGTSTRWCAHKDQRTDFMVISPYWMISVSTGRPTMLKTIKLWNANNTESYPNRVWKDIKVLGRLSSVGGDYTTIKSIYNLNLDANNSGLAGEIDVNATVPYDEYRIIIYNNKGDDYMQMADMKFVVSYPDPESPYSAYFPETLYNGGQTTLPSVTAVASGMIVQIREGSAAKDYNALAPLISEAPGQVMFCTDDCHPTDFVRGHLDRIVRRAIADGYDILDILTAACLTPVKHYSIPAGLLQPGDPADFIVLTDLTPHFRVIKTYIDGEKVFSSKGQFTANRMLERSMLVQKNLVRSMINNFNAQPITCADIARTPRSKEDIIVSSDGSLFTVHERGPVDSSVQKLVVLDRYSANAKPQVAYIKGFGITCGAVAQSIAHDCHNIVAVGSDDKELVRVINRVIEMKGGVAVSDGTDLEDLPLPIAGIISPLCGHELAFRCTLLDEVIKRAGCQFHSPFITLAFMCLPVIPQLKLTDKGLFDSEKFQFVE